MNQELGVHEGFVVSFGWDKVAAALVTVRYKVTALQVVILSGSCPELGYRSRFTREDRRLGRIAETPAAAWRAAEARILADVQAEHERHLKVSTMLDKQLTAAVNGAARFCGNCGAELPAGQSCICFDNGCQ